MSKDVIFVFVGLILFLIGIIADSIPAFCLGMGCLVVGFLIDIIDSKEKDSGDSDSDL